MTATTKQARPDLPGELRTALSRRWPLVVTLMLAAMLASSCGIFNRSSTSASTDFLVQTLPDDWTPMTEPAEVNGFQQVSIDDDEAKEYLLFFYYDSQVGATNGPIGGIIYDGQDDTAIYDPNTVIPMPMQPLAFFVPYRLLPDWTAGKGQGYLGDESVTWEVTPEDQNSGFEAELVVQGIGANGATTRLSLFRWLGPKNGYGVTYFQGSYSITMPDWTAGEGQRIDKVVTLEAFNDRSKLCSQTDWTRQSTSAQFTATPSNVTFCLGAIPAQPTYPEEVVLAWLKEQNSEFALTQDSQDQLLLVVPNPPQQIVSLIYPGTATVSGTGNTTMSTMTVESTIVQDGVQRVVKWHLREVMAAEGGGTTRWRIELAE
ncbi:MAG: hypothetical protein KDH08_00860 [Anaerolineae bacterium]|nr:hypothetical protein [Anaerolineae bacterium]MCB0237196.1 hypothetical protein [Anaerolineae bacterium]MCB9131541.1 hypothetical protein [Anaerolineales bacterium]MCO5243110.1 hypothetical protein [Anaerolineae bacterium]